MFKTPYGDSLTQSVTVSQYCGLRMLSAGLFIRAESARVSVFFGTQRYLILSDLKRHPRLMPFGTSGYTLSSTASQHICDYHRTVTLWAELSPRCTGTCLMCCSRAYIVVTLRSCNRHDVIVVALRLALHCQPPSYLFQKQLNSARSNS